ncbi:hypothetical protein C0993_002516 [Termitomyces sp. T159_Od127]|nr:hypothetical protein C0993_002516 [Termitomyces sp. T159_Od127]
MFHGHVNEFDTLQRDEYMCLEDTMSLDDIQGPLLSLPPLTRQFCIPALTDEPQNPIMYTLQRDQESKSTSLLFKHPQDFGSLVVDPPSYSPPRIPAYDFWKDASTRQSSFLGPAASFAYQTSIFHRFLVGTRRSRVRSREILDEQKTPEEYPTLNPSPVALLSSIYTHLERHIERQSPRTIIAIFAFMLTHVSHDYLQQLSQSVGHGVDSVKKASRGPSDNLTRDLFEDEDEVHEEDIFDLLERVEEKFPEFFPKKLIEILPAAQKSLILLERARPDHPMLQRTVKQGAIHWFWTETSIEAAWKGHYPHYPGRIGENVDDSPLSVKDSEDNQELAIFRIFDQEPGVSPVISTALAKAQTLTRTLQSFIDVFPASLPSITPTLSHLTSLVLAPLLDHSSALSSALLALFLTPSSAALDTLNFEAHLTLLRSYLLVTFPPFRARLATALFSDTVAGDVDNKVHGMAIRLHRKPSSRKAAEKQQEQLWAVGLAPSLLERETWPPVGADLSFFLRTVIVDSIDSYWRGNSVDFGRHEKVRSRVLEEAEYRLGFAIRDLPIELGRDKWLNPLSQPLFPTLTRSRKALFHLRFVAQTYVSNLSAYVSDIAISGNFDPFLTSLAMHGKDENRNETSANFSDVFALAKSHSALLDDILTACLLRSGQRAIGDVLQSTLEIILEFTVAVGQLYSGRVEEYQAAIALEDISKKFYSRMATLVGSNF